jgi:hypothetical protein
MIACHEGGQHQPSIDTKTLDVSNNSFGKLALGDQVKLKSSGEMCSLTMAPDNDNEVKVTKVDGSQSSYMKRDLFEWESQFPAFCAGIAASQSLTSVSKMLTSDLIPSHAKISVFFNAPARCIRPRPILQGRADQTQAPAADPGHVRVKEATNNPIFWQRFHTVITVIVRPVIPVYITLPHSSSP